MSSSLVISLRFSTKRCCMRPKCTCGPPNAVILCFNTAVKKGIWRSNFKNLKLYPKNNSFLGHLIRLSLNKMLKKLTQVILIKGLMDKFTSFKLITFYTFASYIEKVYKYIYYESLFTHYRLVYFE